MRAPTRILNVKQVIHPAYDEVMAARPDIVFDRLDGDASEQEFAEHLAAALGYQIMSLRDGLHPRFYITPEALAGAPNLLFVSTNGSGYDTVDVAACSAAGVLVVNQAGGNAEAVAEHAMSMILALSKRVVQNDRLLRRTPSASRPRVWGSELYGKTLGIVGMGRVGSRLARICCDGFAMTVLGYDPHRTDEDLAAGGVRRVSFTELLEQSDVISVNCPRTPETVGLFDAAAFGRMRQDAYFVTTARGGIHDEAALADALGAGRLAGAGIDVWSSEPPEPDHPLLRFDNVIATDHLAGSTTTARINTARIGAEQLIALVDGHRPPRMVNPEVWPVFAERFERTVGRRTQDN